MKLIDLVFVFAMILSSQQIQGSMYHHGPTQEWKKENTLPFDELILSWNAQRPTDGTFLFYIRIKANEWSPWLLYATWGSSGQSSFSETLQDGSARLHQDTLEMLNGKKATGFEIKITAEGNAAIDNIYALHVYTNGDKLQESIPFYKGPAVYIDVPGLSQMTLDHPRYCDLCSPTSTTAVTRFLTENDTIDPVNFAQKVWDSGFDIFGNWVFSVAQAASLLGPEWHCWVERLNCFEGIYSRLQQGKPVIISVRGPLTGSAQPYAQGHLMAVIGFDPLHQQVICMDSAFPTDEETHVRYKLSDFMAAWERRGRVAYIFDKIDKIP